MFVICIECATFAGRFVQATALRLLVFLSCVAPLAQANVADYAFQKIADTSGPFGSFVSANMNERGQVGFIAGFDSGGRGVFRGDGAILTTIAEDGGFLSGIDGDAPDINNSGAVVFKGVFELRDVNGQVYSRDGIFTGAGGGFPGVVAIADGIQFGALEGTGSKIDDAGNVVFAASLQSIVPTIGRITTSSIFKATPGGYETIVSVIEDCEPVIGICPYRVGSPVVSDESVAYREMRMGDSSIKLSRDGEAPAVIVTSGAQVEVVLEPIHVTKSGTVIFSGRSGALGIEVYTGFDGLVSLVGDVRDLPGIDLASVHAIGTANVAANDCGQMILSWNTAAGHTVFTAADGVGTALFGTGDSLFGSVLESVEAEDVNDLGQIVFTYELRNEGPERGIAIATPIGGRPGDVNHDGRVNLCDTARLAANFGAASGARWIDGDFNGDGHVGLADLHLLQSNFDAVAPAPHSSAAIPEPATLAILLGFLPGIVFVAWHRRERKRDKACPSRRLPGAGHWDSAHLSEVATCCMSPFNKRGSA